MKRLATIFAMLTILTLHGCSGRGVARPAGDTETHASPADRIGFGQWVSGADVASGEDGESKRVVPLPPEGVRLYNEILMTHHDQPMSYEQALRKQKDLEQMCSTFVSTYPRSGRTQRIHLLFAEALFASGKIDRSIGEFRTILDKYPGDGAQMRASLELGYAYLEAGRAKAGAEQFADLLESYPQSLTVPAARFGRGYAYQNMFRYDLALADYRHLILSYPKSDYAKKAIKYSDSIGMVGREAPDFILRNRHGEEVSPKSYRGKTVLVNFWASWGVFCQEEFSYLKKAYQKYKDRDFIILGINLDEDITKRDAFLEANDATWPQLFGEAEELREVARTYNVPPLTKSFLLDRDGVMRYTELHGALIEKAIEQMISAEEQTSTDQESD